MIAPSGGRVIVTFEGDPATKHQKFYKAVDLCHRLWGHDINQPLSERIWYSSGYSISLKDQEIAMLLCIAVG